MLEGSLKEYAHYWNSPHLLVPEPKAPKEPAAEAPAPA